MTTVHDVAKLAGVSPITVSRVVNGAENVNPETRARVERAIEELGYVRNLTARSLRSRRSYTLALILPDITNTFWTTVARGVEDAAQGSGYSVLLCNTDESPEKFNRYLNTMIQQRVDGVMVVPSDTDSHQLERLNKIKIPAVVIDRRVNNWEGDSVHCDSVAGAQALVQHLIALGHSQIAIVSGPAVTSTAEDRVAGYCLALSKAGIPIDQRLIWRGEYKASSGRAMTKEMLESGLTPTAILAANNAIVAGVLDELKRQGKKVPGDMAVVCFDEMPELERLFPFLTTVSQPAYDIGANATQLLLSRIHSTASLRPRQVILPTRMILRYSCGRFLPGAAGELAGAHPEAQVDFSLLPELENLAESRLIKPLDEVDRELLRSCAPNFVSIYQKSETELEIARPNRERLMKTLAFQKADRIPFLDNRGAGEEVMQFVLGRSLRYAADGINVYPEDAIEFAQQMGLDAIPCAISWKIGGIGRSADDELAAKIRQLFPPPPLTNQLNLLENLLRAAEGSGVGVYARFDSFFQLALAAIQVTDPAALARSAGIKKLSASLDMLVKHQERVMRAICDRFGRELCFIAVQDDFLARPDIVALPELYEDHLLPRLQHMITPAREHGLHIALDTSVSIAPALPGLHAIGVNIIQSASPETNALKELAHTWYGKVAFIGGISSAMLARSTKAEIETDILQTCKTLAQHSGFALGLDHRLGFTAVSPAPSSQTETAEVGTEFPDAEFFDVPPQNFISLVRAIQRYGKYL